MSNLSWIDFMKVDFRVGTIVDVRPFPEAHNPAWKLWVDFGEELEVKCSNHTTLPGGRLTWQTSR